uniref:Uncharacterized protein n=1 Tax=Rhizophora mucronata TaxID=61149 RepID=A0A2P2PLY9_RHIMU
MIRRDVKQWIVLEILPNCSSCTSCIVTSFWIIIHVIKQPSEVNKDGPRSGRGNLVGMHLLRRSIWGNCY